MKLRLVLLGILVVFLVGLMLATVQACCGITMKEYGVYSTPIDVELSLIKGPIAIIPSDVESTGDVLVVWKNHDTRNYMLIEDGYLEEILYPGDYFGYIYKGPLEYGFR